MCLLALNTQSQVIYEDRFDDNILSVGDNPQGYTMNLSADNLQIVGNGSAGPWTAMSYMIHDGLGTSILLDADASPKLYIRARGQGTPSLRIDLQDEEGYVTNLNPIELTLSNDYNVYEYNFTNSLSDGAYGGTPCNVQPCPVDASRIRGLVLFVNAATGGYNGDIDIDWISVGAPLADLDFVPHDIRYNQVSYTKGKDKLINITASIPYTDLDYAIYREGMTSPIMTGTVSSDAIWQSSQEHIGTVDISSLDDEGNYTFETIGKTIDFSISTDGYDALSEASLKYYYYNRASQELEETYAGPWARPLGHEDDQVRVHSSAASADRPTGTIISSPKGWYDAGDYNKYIVNSGISTYTLLAAYEHYPEYYNALKIDIPEQGNALPDLLDEVIWNLDWMLSMQDPFDGGVYHKLTGLNFSGIVMPHQYNATRYVVQKSTSAALNFAAVTAIASRVFADFEDIKPGYSAQLIDASKRAYTWAKENPTRYYNQPSDVKTGEYGDNFVLDEFDWAASELFITTGESNFGSDINEIQIGNGVPNWQYTAPLALISLTANAQELGSSINMDIIQNKLLFTANQLRSTTNESPMRVAMGNDNNDFVWGSNGNAGNQILLLIRAYDITGDESYLDAAHVAMDYLLGRNGTGFCYVSGFGKTSPKNPHHRASEADNVADPVPGMVAGGPNPGQQDGCSGYISSSPAGSYVDSWCSYASNEVTINWNAPLAYAVNALRFYQNGTPTSTEDISAVQIDQLKVFPNPGKNQIQIPQIQDNLNQDLVIMDVVGNPVYSKIGVTTPNIDVTNLQPGIYVIKLSTEHEIMSTMWVKAD